MLSPVKAMTVGALALVLGAAFLATDRIDQQSSVPSADQGAQPMAPVPVTTSGPASVTCDEDSGYREDDEYVSRGYGTTCTIRNQWSDPRLQGTETYVVNAIDYMDDSELFIGHYIHDIVNDDGAWRMRPQFRFDSSDGLGGDGPGSFSGTWVLDGDGDYEGLSVVLAKDDENLSGFIVSTDVLPPAPERAAE